MSAVAPVMIAPEGVPIPIMPRYATICSVYPQEKKQTLLRNGKWFDYILPKADPEKRYSTLRVWDSYQFIRNVNGDPEGRSPDAFVPMVTPGNLEAQALVNLWTTAIIGAGRNHTPGIAVIQGDQPTADELERLHHGQTEFARAMVQEADELYEKHDFKLITEHHRLMADYLGLRRPWRAPIERIELKKCGACGEYMRKEATVCFQCKTDLVQLHIDRNYAPDEDDDPVVYAAWQKARSAKARNMADERRFWKLIADFEVLGVTEAALGAALGRPITEANKRQVARMNQAKVMMNTEGKKWEEVRAWIAREEGAGAEASSEE